MEIMKSSLLTLECVSLQIKFSSRGDWPEDSITDTKNIAVLKSFKKTKEAIGSGAFSDIFAIKLPHHSNVFQKEGTTITRSPKKCMP